MSADAAHLLPGLGSGPETQLLRFDFPRSLALLVRLDRAQLAQASFLDDRLLAGPVLRQWVDIRAVVECAQHITDPRPLHFIFHTGHVGSTLLSRLVEAAGGVLALREPFPLRQVAAAFDLATQPEARIDIQRLDRVFKASLTLLCRGFPDTRAVVVKATSVVGRLAPRILGVLPEARAICLNVRPEIYLATYLANAASLGDLQPMVAERKERLLALGLSSELFATPLSGGELAAMAWLVESWTQQRALALLPGQLLAMDFDGLLADLNGGMRRVLAHLGLPHDADTVDRVAAGPSLGRYAKAQDLAFTPQVRASVLREAMLHNDDALRCGMAWLDRAATSHPEAARVRDYRAPE